MQGNFTKENAQLAIEAVDEIFKALPKSKKMDYLGHLNEVFMFLENAKKIAPVQTEAAQ